MSAKLENQLYGTHTITISEIIGRRFNNPLGEWPLRRFAGIFSGDFSAGVPRVLDIGSGRGRVAARLIRSFGAEVTGVEISPEMHAFAERLLGRSISKGKAQMIRGDFLSLDFPVESFDVAVSFDVFSYFRNKDALFAKIARDLRKGGKLLFSDYYCLPQGGGAVDRLVESWQLSRPGEFSFYREMLGRHGFTEFVFENTTPRYRRHWLEMRRRCLARREKIIAATSEAAFDEYLRSVENILSAVATGGFGHLLCLAEKK